MKRCATLVLLGMLTVDLGCRRAPSAAAGSPASAAVRESASRPGSAVSFVPEMVDLGDVPWGRTFPLTFTLTNSGGGSVTIANVSASCGCTVAKHDYKGTCIASGESVSVEFAMFTGLGTGPKAGTLQVDLDGGEKVVAAAQANVVGTFTLSEESVDFGRVDAMQEDALRRVLRVITRDITVEDVRTSAASINATVAQGDGSVDILVELQPSAMSAGQFYATLTIATSDPDRSVVNVPVKAFAVLELTPVPSSVYLRLGETRVIKFRDSELTIVPIQEYRGGGKEVLTEVTSEGGLRLTNRQEPGRASTAQIVVKDAAGRGGRVTVYCIGK